jgi:tryptophan synthase alpha chain
VPIEEAGPVIEGCKSSGVDPIFMVAPTTTEERLRKILVHADGFLYLVALLGVTGARGDLHPEALQLIRKVRSQTDLPVCVGFGISRPEHVRALSRAGADGAIVGSAIVNLIARNLRTRGKLPEVLRRYVHTMKKQTLPAGRS